VYVLPEFGGRAIAAITPRDCEQFLAALVGRGLTPATLKHHWSVLRNVFAYAVRHKAITANPVDGVDFSANSAQRRNRRHHPLTAEQVAAVANSIGTRYPVYEMLTYFAAYTGLRAEELAGLEVGDLVFAPGPSCIVHVRRAKKRRAGEWTTDTLKSAKSRRMVPLLGWLSRSGCASTSTTPTRPQTNLPPRCGLTGRSVGHADAGVGLLRPWTLRSRAIWARTARTC
jgi:integrase